MIWGVVHLAALKAVGESGEKPLDYYRVNVSGSLTLLEVSYNHSFATRSSWLTVPPWPLYSSNTFSSSPWLVKSTWWNLGTRALGLENVSKRLGVSDLEPTTLLLANILQPQSPRPQVPPGRLDQPWGWRMLASSSVVGSRSLTPRRPGRSRYIA
jgi:hypothetical protein